MDAPNMSKEGTRLVAMVPPIERFLAKTVATDHGLIWIASVNVVSGYGQFSTGPRATRRVALAHKYWYEYNNGTVPQGYDVDHACHIKRCLTHLQLLPASVNRRKHKARKYRLDSERRIFRGLKISRAVA